MTQEQMIVAIAKSIKTAPSKIEEAYAALDETEKRHLRLRYGVEEQTGHLMAIEYVAHKMGLTRDAAMSRERIIFKKLKALIAR